MAAMTDAQVDRLEQAKNLLSRTRMGGKAVVALGLAPVHVRLASPKEANHTLVLSEEEPIPLLAVRLGAIGMRLQFPELADEAVRTKALEIADDLARRLGGEEEQLLRSTALKEGFVLGLPRGAPAKKAKKLKVLPKGQRTKWAKKGWLWLGTFEVGEGGVVLGDEAALGTERALALPARAGQWFAFAEQPLKGKAPDPQGSLAGLFACLSDEVEGLDELLAGAKPAGQVTVEGGTLGLVDSEWRDRGELEKWTEEVEEPFGKASGCRVGERGLVCGSGEGDGVYPASTFTGRDGKALLVRVAF